MSWYSSFYNQHLSRYFFGCLCFYFLFFSVIRYLKVYLHIDFHDVLIPKPTRSYYSWKASYSFELNLDFYKLTCLFTYLYSTFNFTSVREGSAHLLSSGTIKSISLFSQQKSKNSREGDSSCCFFWTAALTAFVRWP